VRFAVSISSRILLTVFMLASVALAARAGEMSGTWDVEGSVEGHPVNYACTFLQEGDRLSGTARVQEKDIPVAGTFDGTKVTWAFEVEHEGAPLELVFTGTLTSENEITGTIAVASTGGQFTAKRQGRE
jgi:hypothetical protein